MMYTFKCDPADIRRMKLRHPGLYEALYQVIERIDPVDLAWIPDEYSLEVNDIMVNLTEVQSPKDVREMVIQVFEYWFNGFTEPFYSDKYFHHHIWAIRQRFKVRSA